MQPFLADAAYVNYLREVNDEGVRAAYGRKYERLAALKDKYDPTNFFAVCVPKATLAAKAPIRVGSRKIKQTDRERLARGYRGEHVQAIQQDFGSHYCKASQREIARCNTLTRLDSSAG